MGAGKLRPDRVSMPPVCARGALAPSSKPADPARAAGCHPGGEQYQLLTPAGQEPESSAAGALLLLGRMAAPSASLVVAADGAHSWSAPPGGTFPSPAGIMATTPWWRRALCRAPRGGGAPDLHPRAAFAFLLPVGPISAPIVWSVPAKRGPRRCAPWMTSGFSPPAHRRLRWQARAVQGGGARSAIPLTARYARDFCPQAAGAGGDAATIHPLAGGGEPRACWMPRPWRNRSSNVIGAGRISACWPTCAGTSAGAKAGRRMLAAMEGSSGCLQAATPSRSWCAGVGLCAVDALAPSKAGHDPGPPWGWTGSCLPLPKGEKI